MAKVTVYRRVNGILEGKSVDQGRARKMLQAGWALEPFGGDEPKAGEPQEKPAPKKRGRPKKAES